MREFVSRYFLDFKNILQFQFKKISLKNLRRTFLKIVCVNIDPFYRYLLVTHRVKALCCGSRSLDALPFKKGLSEFLQQGIA